MTTKNDKFPSDTSGDDCFNAARMLLEDPASILANIMMSMGDGLSIQDRNMRIVYQNKFMIDNFGSHIGKYCYNIYEKRSSVCEGCPIIESYRTGQVTKALRVGVTKDGLSFRFENIASVLRNEKGEIVAGIELCRIVEEREKAFDELRETMEKLKETQKQLVRAEKLAGIGQLAAELVHINERLTQEMRERQSAEESLRKSEQRYRSLFKESKDAIVITLPHGEIVDANPAFEELFGSTREQIIGSNVLRFYKNTADRARFAEELERRGFVKEFHLEVRREDGTERICRLTSSLWRDEQRAILAYFTIVRDITESMRLQEQLAHSQKLESVGRLAGGVAHDFNNMLTVILGRAELALMRCNPSDLLHADLQVIIETGRRTASLVGQLLAFARKQTAAPKVIDLNDTTTGTLKMLQRLLGEDIELVWKPVTGLWPVKIDPSQVDQLLINFCINARDAIEGAGKVTIETDNASFNEAYCAMHAEFSPGDYVMLAVSDNGCGMSKEVIDQLFEPFFTTKQLGKGTGLGLATAYGIVKQNGGFINVYSEPGEGSTFKVFFPRVDREAVKPALAKVSEAPRGHGETVLLVEDEAAILEVCQTMLEGLDFTVLTARKPSEALRLAQSYSGKIHLLITDVVMPEMNGRQLAELLRELRPELKCMFSSGYTANVIAHHGVLNEGVQFLQKPYSLNDLATKIQETLEKEES
ncbi:MAG: PAS domain S-box protein [Desulfobacteraceae bacterium]|jgi:PAS domain S-box-containing protein